VCLLLSIGLAALFVPIPWISSQFSLWLAAQSTFARFFNPEFLRTFATGALNGSLRTITIEIQFYLALPVLFILWQRVGSTGVLAVVTVTFLGHAAFLDWVYGTRSMVARIFQVSIFAWLGFFLVVVLAQRYWKHIANLNERKFCLWWAIYLATSALLGGVEGMEVGGNAINTLSAILLGYVVIDAAHSRPTMSAELLRSNDISYGMYLYHCPSINAVMALQTGWSPEAHDFAIFSGTVALAIFSWIAVERPALSLKGRLLGCSTRLVAGIAR
jgi:peptidoglycan/LPS O-acetylase OafA/YrhL